MLSELGLVRLKLSNKPQRQLSKLFDAAGAANLFSPIVRARLATDGFFLCHALRYRQENQEVKTKMKHLFFVLVLSLGLVGCASYGEKIDPSKIQNIKKGETTYEQCAQWFGKPINRMFQNDGSSIAMWMYVESSSTARNFIPVVNLVSMKVNTESTTLSITFDSENKVVTVNHSEGNNSIRAGIVK